MIRARLYDQIRDAERAASLALSFSSGGLGFDTESVRRDIVHESIQLARRLLSLAVQAEEGVGTLGVDGYAVPSAGRIDSLIAVLRALENLEEW